MVIGLFVWCSRPAGHHDDGHWWWPVPVVAPRATQTVYIDLQLNLANCDIHLPHRPTLNFS